VTSDAPVPLNISEPIGLFLPFIREVKTAIICRSLLLIVFVWVIGLMQASSADAQLIAIGAREAIVDSCLSPLPVVPSDDESGDSLCLGAKFWNIEGHLLFHYDSVEHTLDKFDWSAYMPIPLTRADTIAKQMMTSIGPFVRARDHDWLYWIWDNDEVHYMLQYNTGTLRLLEFQDQGSLNACAFH
jgi:hypothetical protein